MVAYAFNANAVQPSYGGDPGLPDGKYKTVIVNTAKVDVEKMGQVTGSYLEITHCVIEGPLKNQTMKDRLNLLHSNPQTVEIANKQLSAYCHVLGVFQFQDTQQLHNIPMMIEVGRQLDKNTKQPLAFGEIKRIFDANGNEPGKQQGGQATQYQPGAQPPPNQPPPAGVQADGGGWGGGAPGGQPPPQGGQGGGWGQPAGGGAQPGNTSPPPPQGQPQGGNWGAPAGGDQGGGFGGAGGAPGGQGGGWAPQGGGAGGAPWGGR